MLYPIKVSDIELSEPVNTLTGLAAYKGFQGLVRIHGIPIGYINLPVSNDEVSNTAIIKEVLQKHNIGISHSLLTQWLCSNDKLAAPQIGELFSLKPQKLTAQLPMISVVVCSRDRSEDLKICLEALLKTDYANFEIIVVDNAPATDDTKQLVANHFPQVRYVLEPRPGLDWARNKGIVEAKGEVVAFTDDDVVVDPGWVHAFAKLFKENPEVMAATGLVVPFEMETEAQVLFEKYGGFGRGFKRKWFKVLPGTQIPAGYLGAGQFGTGANMAYRKTVFDKIGYFDPALDVGTITNGTGDLEMFFRVIMEGFTLVYEPQAMIRHRHRKEMSKLKVQIGYNGSLFTYFVCCVRNYPQTRFKFLRFGCWWMRYWNFRRLFLSFINPRIFPREFILAELKGGFKGLFKYKKSQKLAAAIEKNYGSNIPYIKKGLNILPAAQQLNKATSVRMVELSHPLESLTDVTGFSNVRVYLTWLGNPVGKVDIHNKNNTISSSRLAEQIINELGLLFLNIDHTLITANIQSYNLAELDKHLSQFSDDTASSGVLPAKHLSSELSVTVLVSTYNRPDDLFRCLTNITAQQVERPMEIIVVDNCAGSGLTEPVVAQFPGVKLINEYRQGVSYARNAGISASSGHIIVSTDDDVTMPADWVEKLILPFHRADVMCVSGNILPIELETRSQQLFEEYGGLGRGYAVKEYDGRWFNNFRFNAVPTWELGGTANAAFRSEIFNHPAIGLMDETLGPGMPSGVGEDSYLFYKILKAGYTIYYNPNAFVWHNHRRSIKALRKQIFNYSKGHVSHHITTVIRDKDLRGIYRIFFSLPLSHLYRIKARLSGRSKYPISFLLLEMYGNFLGPWALWRSHRIVKKLGRNYPESGTKYSTQNNLKKEVTQEN
ncbi:MAG: glycosyltransferase family 2 protein [Ferruginibacter sp.]